MGSCIDLTDQMNNPKVADAFSFLVSGSWVIRLLLNARKSLLNVLGVRSS